MAQRSEDRRLATLDAPRRGRPFYGQLLDVPSLRLEQDYHRLRQALHGRLSLGKGVLCGLGVRVETERVCFTPGVAMDGLGREIVVPHEVCFDPWGREELHPCCGERRRRDPDTAHRVTVLLCYRECLADFAPSMVMDCATQDRCEASTTVETYCLRIVEGRPEPRPPSPGCEALREHDPGLSHAARIARRRERLCEVLEGNCEADPDEACVPLVSLDLLPGGRIGTVEVCAFRPRLYSNETLLELMLCLADRIEECCRGRAFRVVGVSLGLGTSGPPPVMSPDPPLRIQASYDQEIHSILVEFNEQVEPSTLTPQALSEPPEKHSFLVIDEVGNPVPGTVAEEGSTGARYTIDRDRGIFSPGTYTVRLAGDKDPTNMRPTITTTSGAALDGEPLSLPSGDSAPGGDFVFELQVIREPGGDAFRVVGVSLGLGTSGPPPVMSPDRPLRIRASIVQEVTSILVEFNDKVDPSTLTPKTLRQRPKTHSFLVVDQFGNPVRGTVAEEGPNGARYTIARGASFATGTYTVRLAGDTDPTNTRPTITSTSGAALDGEPLSLPSGDGAPGGDFVFELEIRET